MKAAEIQKLSREAAEEIIVELADELPIKKLTLAELAGVLGAIQLGFARGMLKSATMQGERMAALMPGLGTFGKPKLVRRRPS